MFDACGPFDSFDSDAIMRAMTGWCESRLDHALPHDDLDSYLNTVTPRSIFLKNLKSSATVMDMGAGNGALAIYKEWPSIPRTDIRLYGVSLDPIEHADKYEETRIQNFEDNPNMFLGLQFDAIMASHFIEHLSKPKRFLAWASRSLTSSGRMYIEWPHPISMRMPESAFFKQMGIPVTTTHFFDDKTHVEAWPAYEIIALARHEGLVLESAGRVLLPYVADLLRDRSRVTQSHVDATFSVWLATGWPQYVVLRKASSNLD